MNAYQLNDAHTTVFSTKTDRLNVLPQQCECAGCCPRMDMGRLVQHVFYPRCPWLKCQVDWPSEEEAITPGAQLPEARGRPRKSREARGLGKISPHGWRGLVTLPFISWFSSLGLHQLIDSPCAKEMQPEKFASLPLLIKWWCTLVYQREYPPP